MPEIIIPVAKVVFWPLIYLVDRKIKRRNEVGSGIRAPEHYKPAKLGRTRRPLTPSASRSASPSLFRPKQPKCNDQALSPLLAKLPAELRIMVWKMCLDTDVHMFDNSGHLCAFRCRANNARDASFGSTHWKCLGQKEPEGWIGGKGKASESRSRVALILTCRRV